MSDGLDPTSLPEGRGIPAKDWQQTPPSVRHQFLSLFQRVAALEARLNRDSSNSSRPPSTDAPSTKRYRRMKATDHRRPGGQHGHPGHAQVLLAPTATVTLFPDACACGHRGFEAPTAYHTHQVIEFPVMHPEGTHWLLHQGRCLSCGTLCKALLPRD